MCRTSCSVLRRFSREPKIFDSACRTLFKRAISVEDILRDGQADGCRRRASVGSHAPLRRIEIIIAELPGRVHGRPPARGGARNILVLGAGAGALLVEVRVADIGARQGAGHRLRPGRRGERKAGGEHGGERRQTPFRHPDPGIGAHARRHGTLQRFRQIRLSSTSRLRFPSLRFRSCGRPTRKLPGPIA